jgi:hypothetical protein
MKWVLFVMLFTTPAYDQKPGAKKDETKHLWTLQSSSTMEFDTHTGCMTAGARINTSIKPVGNLTFRGLCLCESTDPNNTCPENHDPKLIEMLRPQEKQKGVSTGFDVIPTK